MKYDPVEQPTRVTEDTVVYADRVVKIAARAPARLSVPNQPGHFVDAKQVEELVFEDGTTVFYCAHQLAVDCVYFGPTPKSVVSHQRTHSPKLIARQLRRELSNKTHELDAIKARRHMAGQRAWQTRQTKNTTNTVTPDENPGQVVAAMDARHDADYTFAEREEQHVRDEITYLRGQLNELLDKLVLAAKLGNCDHDPVEIEALRRKAQKWDNIQANLRD